MVRLLEVAFGSGIGGGTVLHCIVKGEAREGRVVSCLDGGKPGGWDWIAGRGMVEVDKCIDAGEVVGIVGLMVSMGRHNGRLSRRTGCGAGCAGRRKVGGVGCKTGRQGGPFWRF